MKMDIIDNDINIKNHLELELIAEREGKVNYLTASHYWKILNTNLIPSIEGNLYEVEIGLFISDSETAPISMIMHPIVFEKIQKLEYLVEMTEDGKGNLITIYNHKKEKIDSVFDTISD